MEYILNSPLRLPQTKKKDFVLNLNIYRNTHYRTLNTMKIRYRDFMKPQILRLPKMTKVSITYRIYPVSRRRTDLGNVVSIHKKFFEDSLVYYGILLDDDYKHIISNHEYFGEVDKESPHVEIRIKEIE